MARWVAHKASQVYRREASGDHWAVPEMWLASDPYSVPKLTSIFGEAMAPAAPSSRSLSQRWPTTSRLTRTRCSGSA